MNGSDAIHPSVLRDLDRHFGAFLARLDGRGSSEIRLAAALASAWSGAGHVCLDLSSVTGTTVGDGSGAEERTPALGPWRNVLLASPVVGRPGEWRPLILDDRDRLYLYRSWDDERTLAECLQRRGERWRNLPEGDVAGLLRKRFPRNDRGEIPKTGIAAVAALRKSVVVITGAPGTGKTTAAAMLLDLALAFGGGAPPEIRIAASTGKAAVRLQESLTRSGGAFPPSGRLQATALEAVTLHRLLGASRGGRWPEERPLTAGIVLVDEASMVDLPLMARLVRALPEEGRLILLGDRNQLASVEQGAVLGDICPESALRAFTPAFREDLRRIFGAGVLPVAGGTQGGLCDGLVELEESHRFSPQSGIHRMARAVCRGDAGGVLDILSSGTADDLDWQVFAPPADLARHLDGIVSSGFRPFFAAVRAGKDPEEIAGLFDGFRILCVLRQSARGVEGLNRLVESILARSGLIPAGRTWYAGRPVMVTRNDYRLRLFNGDVGIALPAADGSGGLHVCFPVRPGQVRWVHPLRLPPHETAFASTVHKSQGSEYDEVLFVLPEANVPILTRELVYTAVTRARSRVVVCGDAGILATAVARRTVRHSGLREALWKDGTGDPDRS